MHAVSRHDDDVAPPSLSPTLHCLHLLALECKLQVTLEKWPPVAKALDAVLDPLPTNCHIHLSSAWLIINLTNLLIFVLDEARIIAKVCFCLESPDRTGHSKMTLCTKNSSATTTVPSRDHPRVCNTQTTTGPILEQNRIWPVPPPTWSYTWPFFCFLTKHSLPVNSLLFPLLPQPWLVRQYLPLLVYHLSPQPACSLQPTREGSYCGGPATFLDPDVTER